MTKKKTGDIFEEIKKITDAENEIRRIEKEIESQKKNLNKMLQGKPTKASREMENLRKMILKALNLIKDEIAINIENYGGSIMSELWIYKHNSKRLVKIVPEIGGRASFRIVKYPIATQAAYSRIYIWRPGYFETMQAITKALYGRGYLPEKDSLDITYQEEKNQILKRLFPNH